MGEVCTCSLKTIFFLNIFDMQLVEPKEAEPMDAEGLLYIAGPTGHY